MFYIKYTYPPKNENHKHVLCQNTVLDILLCSFKYFKIDKL